MAYLPVHKVTHYGPWFSINSPTVGHNLSKKIKSKNDHFFELYKALIQQKGEINSIVIWCFQAMISPPAFMFR